MTPVGAIISWLSEQPDEVQRGLSVYVQAMQTEDGIFPKSRETIRRIRDDEEESYKYYRELLANWLLEPSSSNHAFIAGRAIAFRAFTDYRFCTLLLETNSSEGQNEFEARKASWAQGKLSWEAFKNQNLTDEIVSAWHAEADKEPL